MRFILRCTDKAAVTAFNEVQPSLSRKMLSLKSSPLLCRFCIQHLLEVILTLLLSWSIKCIESVLVAESHSRVTWSNGISHKTVASCKCNPYSACLQAVSIADRAPYAGS